MPDEKNILESVRKSASKKILYTPHALMQMSKPERLIRPDEIHTVIDQGEVIEDYPEDIRGHSCLILGFGNETRPIHVVCSSKDDYLAIITAYLPSPDEWSADFRERKKV